LSRRAPKVHRWPLAALLIAAVLFFPFRIVQFICLLYLAVLGASYAYSRATFALVRVRRRDYVLRAHRFEPTEISLTVENTSPLPLSYLTVLDSRGALFSRESGKFVARMRPRERRTFSYFIESQDRGEYLIGPVMLVGSDPLGFFPWRRTEKQAGKIIVYPETLPIRVPLSSGLPAGSIRTDNPVYEDVTHFRSLREYVPGDDARRINWKASAKTGQLHSMEYLPALFSPVLVLLNLNWEEFPLRFRSHWVERSAVTAASLVMHFVSLKQEVGLIVSAVRKDGSAMPAARLGSAPGHATAIMEMLAYMEPARDAVDFVRQLSTSGMDIPAGTRIEVITPKLSDLQHALLRESRQKGMIVECFLVGGDQPELRESLSREFPVHVVTDYGNELLDT
jgi:uncharacterized protein (DUF58 family)